MTEYTLRKLETEEALRLPLELESLNIKDSFKLNAKIKWARPFGMLFSAFALRQYTERHEFDIAPMSYVNTESTSYAGHMGFFKTISQNFSLGKFPGQAKGNDNYIPIKKLDLLDVHKKELESGIFSEMGDSIERESSRLAHILCRDNKDSQIIMTYLIREILRNIPEHAGSSEAWICGQYWANQYAEIAILDEGIGIKNSLCSNKTHREYIKTDKDAIDCALHAGISQAFTPEKKSTSDNMWANSGFGLYMVSEICKKLKGSFCIASGGSYLICPSSGKPKHGLTQFNGTAIKLSICTRELKNSQKIICDIARQGEEEAQSIRNAFKKASIPSKSIIDNI